MLSPTEQKQLLERLIALPKECEWVEFKQSYVEENQIGEYISALSNSACLHNQKYGYLVYGIEDGTHDIVGTDFHPKNTKIGNQELENWLATQLYPKIDFKIYEFDYEGKSISIFQIDATRNQPVRFRHDKFIRVGSYKKKLEDHPEKERKIWKRHPEASFESKIAADNLEGNEVLQLIDYPAFFEMMSIPLPADMSGILDKLIEENLVAFDSGRYSVTNLGAILFAKQLNKFPSLKRKSIRVIIYDGKNKVNTIKEQNGIKGYANGFEGLISWINDQLPENEVIGQALRSKVKMYPEIAIRELVANAIIHQDFEMKGTNPMIEIFDDRIEITNNGKPLVDPLRFIGATPRSRNEELASFMRRLNICEERGSGIIKVVDAVEIFQLPPPDFLVDDFHTIAKLYAYRPLNEMDKKDKIRACYQHTCLKHFSGERMSNKSLRKRFEISDKNYPMASRIISDTIEAGLIKDFDPSSNSKRDASYIPFWA
ncbi:MAG: transcriptional regulator [Balneola sp.]|jgi:predicted HTH transcriptional regulator|nr:transcriptional regulator [Balneola sp.]MBE78370.1 transcriptional regulator [Balneola sp.]|tara:strand:+ start:1031 stop:2488 length:1458 start_codon:yes stop_codon:yes gene_type:complete